MGQPGFFDLSRRYECLDKKKDPLVTLASVVPWELFRPKLHAALAAQDLRTPAAQRKSAAGRKPWDEVLIFKALVVQALYNLSDEQAEYQLRDRLSFMRFLGLGLEDPVPDATTLWLYREALARAGAVEELFAAFDCYLREHGLLAMGGQIVDATIVAAPRQRNSREENVQIKRRQTPAGWKQHPAKASQKDVDARWTKKHGRTYYGYKNHISMDRRHKLVRRYSVTDAACHDSTELDAVLDPDNTSSEVWADSAYRSAEIEVKLAECDFESRIHRRGALREVELRLGIAKSLAGCIADRRALIASSYEDGNDADRLRAIRCSSSRWAGCQMMLICARNLRYHAQTIFALMLTCMPRLTI